MDPIDAPGALDWTFSFAVPEGYLVIDPDWDPDVDRHLIEEAVDGHLARLAKAELEEASEAVVAYVEAYTRTAAREGAIGAAVSVDCVEGGEPIEGFVLAKVVAQLPADGGDPLAVLAAAVAAPQEGDLVAREVTLVDVPAGAAVRLHGIFDTDPEDERSTVVEIVQFWLPVAGSGTQLVLTWSTPQVAYGDHWVPVADAIAETITINPGSA